MTAQFARHQVVIIMLNNTFPYPRIGLEVQNMMWDLYWTLMGVPA